MSLTPAPLVPCSHADSAAKLVQLQVCNHCNHLILYQASSQHRLEPSTDPDTPQALYVTHSSLPKDRGACPAAYFARGAGSSGLTKEALEEVSHGLLAQGAPSLQLLDQVQKGPALWDDSAAGPGAKLLAHGLYAGAGMCLGALHAVRAISWTHTQRGTMQCAFYLPYSMMGAPATGFRVH